MYLSPTLSARYSDHDELSRFAEIWHNARGNALLPERSRLTLGDLRRLANNTILLDYHSPDKILYRLAGSDICDRMGFDPSGQNLLDLMASSQRDAASQVLQTIVDKPCGCALELQSRYQNGKVGNLAQIYLPISGHNGQKMICGYFQYLGWLSMEVPSVKRLSSEIVGGSVEWLDIATHLDDQST